MRRPVTLLLALVLALTLGACGESSPRIPGGRLGSIRLFAPGGSARAFVVWLGAARGWSPADTDAARRLAAGGAIVAGVDLPVSLATLEEVHGHCLYLVGDAEHVARMIQRRLGLDRFHSPILAGVGPGGRLALVMMEQAPPVTLAGAVAVDPAAELQTIMPLCRHPPSDVGVSNDAGAESAIVAFSKQADADGEAARTIAALSLAGLRPKVEPIVARPTAEASLAEMILRHLAMDREGNPTAKDLSDLPLVALPAAAGAPLAIVVSGDGGWRDIDREVAEALHHRGYAVIGWDSLRYFWQAKTPETLAQDLTRVLAAYQARWRPSRIVLVGYSFGADVLPFAFNRLPAELRRKIVQISLLGYAGRADFEIRVAGWLGAGPGDAALDGGPDMARIDPRLIQCFYGAEEGHSACPRLEGRGAEVIRTSGGHHFDGGYTQLAQRIADGAAARALPEHSLSSPSPAVLRADDRSSGRRFPSPGERSAKPRLLPCCGTRIASPTLRRASSP